MMYMMWVGSVVLVVGCFGIAGCILDRYCNWMVFRYYCSYAVEISLNYISEWFILWLVNEEVAMRFYRHLL